MPIYTAADVMDYAAGVYLGDPSKNRYTYTLLLPHLKGANNEFQALLALSSQSDIRKTLVPDTTISTGGVTLTLPSDFFLPVSLEEKGVSETDDKFVRMTELAWSKSATQSTTLRFWVYSGLTINFLGATQDRIVRLRYYRTVTQFASSITPLDDFKALRFLAAKTAELAARFAAHNKEKADDIRDNETLPAKDDLERIIINNSQGTRVRHRSGKRNIGRRV